jgi:hypothetical protein
MKLQNRLILNKYLLSLFGVESFAATDSNLFGKNLRDILIDAREGINEEGKSYYFITLTSASLKIEDKLLNKIEKYDRNIVEYLNHINASRDNPITLKYFQYLAVLFTEIYLDRYFNERDRFLDALNDFVDRENKKIKKESERYSHFTESDLHKLAFYMATGSGKTLIMHINYLQYLKYTDREIDNIILVTPNSGLSQQHINEFQLSNIQADLFLNLKGGLFDKGPVIKVIEITKLVETKSGEGESVEIGSFEGHNLVLVDEGHKGSGGDVWKENREMLARDGFIFEYSATFGQAVGSRVDRSEQWNNETEYTSERVNELGLSSEVVNDIFNINKNKSYINMSLYQLENKMKECNLPEAKQARIRGLYTNLLEEYSKAIIFDYSYKFFYEDGYGKDYHILNLSEARLKEYNDDFLLANLISFYEQMLLFQEKKDELEKYNLEKPLLIFVGHTVSASGSLTNDDKASISDVEFVIHFIEKFISDRIFSITSIENIVYKKGFKDRDGQDVFADRFTYLRSEQLSPEDIYNDILMKVFNTSPGSTSLELYEIKNAAGEIGLKVKGADYFGLINIGDVSRLAKKLEEKKKPVREDEFADSFFNRINSDDSNINVMIGSRKFTEGWNSYRVSSIGLLNIGRSEGSQIIQLFGRGVRLRGLNNSLKRSTVFERQSHPEYIEVLETLNVFGIKADYMEKFREYLEKEGIDNAGYEEVVLPIKPDDRFLEKGLLTIKSAEGYNFEKDKFIVLDVDKDIEVTVDLRPKLERLSSSSEQERMEEDTKEQNYYIDDVEEDVFAYINWDMLFLEMIDYKKQRKYDNLLIIKEHLKEIIASRLYRLYCNETDLTIDSFEKIANIEEVISKILKKYISAFYQARKLAYENTHLKFTPLTREDSNFQDYLVKIEKKNKRLLKEIKELISRKDVLYDERLEEIEEIPNIYFDRHLFQPLLVQGGKIKTSPVGLNQDEKEFIKRLKEFFLENKDNNWLKKREIFILRNLTRGKGVGFYVGGNFYPDFILWIKEKERQFINFIDPKGILMLHYLENPKIKLHETLKDIEEELKGSIDQKVILNSFIISNTDSNTIWRQWKRTKEELERDHVLFAEDRDVIARMFKKTL